VKLRWKVGRECRSTDDYGIGPPPEVEGPNSGLGCPMVLKGMFESRTEACRRSRI